MSARLTLLDDLTPAATSPRLRNAPAAPRASSQARLKQYLQALVTAYGYRPDYQGTSPPWQVPYLPAPFAAAMLEDFRRQGHYWLRQSIPEAAKQPRFITRWTQRAGELLGLVVRGVLVVPASGRLEDAPPDVAARAPSMFGADAPAGQPHPRVLIAKTTWEFLDALLRLAIHFDALAGQPEKLDLFIEAVKERAEELRDRAAEQLQRVVELPATVAKSGKTALTWLAVAGASLGLLYVVTR